MRTIEQAVEYLNTTLRHPVVRIPGDVAPRSDLKPPTVPDRSRPPDSEVKSPAIPD